MTFKLGKKPARLDKRTLKFSNYVKLPIVPNEVSWITKLVAAEPIPMYLNDNIGDCTIAGAAHMIQQWNFYAGHPARPTDQEVLRAYEAVSGYNPNDPSTDQGADMLTVLKYWRNIGIGNHKIQAFVSVNPTDPAEVKAAIYLFGGLYIGLALPISAEPSSTGPLDPWTVANGGINTNIGAPGGLGGHCVNIVAASDKSRTVETWGQTLKMSPNFMNDYCDECYVLLSSEWMNTQQVSPGNFDMSQLLTDLSKL
jgi:hypothetical protein